MPFTSADLKRRLKDLADSFESIGGDTESAEDKAKGKKVELKKKKRKAQRRLLDRDDRSLKERLIDYAKGSDNYSRMGDARKKKEDE